MSQALLHDFLADYFKDFFADAKVSEISVNRPGEIFVARQGSHEMVRHENPRLTYSELIKFFNLVAQSTSQKISEETPLLSAQIPTVENPDKFYRIQLLRDPAVTKNTCAFSIRKPALLNLPYEAYQNIFSGLTQQKDESDDDKHLYDLYEQGAFWEFLRYAVLYRKNIIISAGTDSGKTTLFNALIGLIPLWERIITIEDAKELTPTQLNILQLYYSRGGQGKARVTAQDLMEACLRLRPNRILAGEIRGAEAFTFLNLISSGHPGAITTVHANSPAGALDRMGLMVLQGDSTLTMDLVKEYVRQNIDVIVQMERTVTGGYGCSAMYYKGWHDKQTRKAT